MATAKKAVKKAVTKKVAYGWMDEYGSSPGTEYGSIAEALQDASEDGMTDVIVYQVVGKYKSETTFTEVK